VNLCSSSLYAIARPSVCLSSVTLVREGAPTLQTTDSRLKFLAIFLRRLVPWPSVDIQGKIYGDRSRGTPPSGGGLNARGVAKYSDFSHLECFIDVNAVSVRRTTFSCVIIASRQRAARQVTPVSCRSRDVITMSQSMTHLSPRHSIDN